MNPCSIPKSERENIAPKQEDNNTSHLNHDGEDERLAKGLNKRRIKIFSYARGAL